MPPGVQQTVPVTVTNLDGSSTQQGDLSLHLWNLDGTEALSTNTHVTLGAGGSQQYNLGYSAPGKGLYVLEVSLGYSGKETTVIYELLSVRANQIFLPVTLRNYVAIFEGPHEREPNDAYWQANGSLISGRNYTGYPSDEEGYLAFTRARAAEWSST